MATAPLNAPEPVTEVAPPPPRAARTGFLDEIGELVVFSGRALAACVQTPRYFSEVLRLSARIVRRTSFLLLAMNVFLGFSVATFGFFFLRTIGAGDFVGVFTGLLTQRQVPMTMYGWGTWSWDGLRAVLARYRSHFPEGGSDYAAMIDMIRLIAELEAAAGPDGT